MFLKVCVICVVVGISGMLLFFILVKVIVVVVVFIGLLLIKIEDGE